MRLPENINMKKSTILSICIFLICNALSAQQNNTTEKTSDMQPPGFNWCATKVPDPSWDEAFNKEVEKYKSNLKMLGAASYTNYVIPVVVHVIHSGQAEGTWPNISQAQVNSQIDVLNQDYSNNGAGINQYNSLLYNNHGPFYDYAQANNLPAPDNTTNGVVACNTGIQFCLAVTDPNGNILAEPGIDRVNYITKGFSGPLSSTSLTFDSYLDNTLKPAVIWDNTKYMNIYVSDRPYASGLLGYTTFPAVSTLTGITSGVGTTSNDGIWMYGQAFGTTGILISGYTGGQVCGHESGHYFGLRHLWGDGACLTDYCNDTPPAYEANYNNNSTIIYPYVDPNGSCTGNVDQGDGVMYMNLMDYSEDVSKFMFTNDQVIRMQTAMQNSPYRKNLGTNGICNSPALIPVSNFTASASTVCAGQSVTLTDNSINTPTSWSWTMTNGTPSSSSVQNPSIIYNTAGTYTVSLIAANSAGSSSSFSKIITVNPNPVVPAITPSGSILTSSAATGNQWYLNSVLINGAVNQTYSTAINGSYTVIVSNSFGCTSTSAVINITADNPPAANFTASAATVCTGQTVILTDNSTNTPASWIWTMANGTPSSSNLQNPSVVYNTAGTYTVTLAAANSFGSSSPASQTITVNATPSVPSISPSGNVLTSNSSSGNQWYLNGVLINGAVNPVYTAAANGAYTVVVTNTFGCSAGSVPFNLTTTGINSIMRNYAVTAFPNPSKGILTLNFSGKNDRINVEVINDLGQLVYSDKINDCSPDCSKIIDMSSFKNGIYLFRIMTDGNIQTQKVMLLK